MNTLEIGRQGERFAAEYLVKNHFTIRAKNYFSRFGEIDIVAQKDDLLIFCEVRSRHIGSLASPVETVDKRKQRKIIKTAYLYLLENPVDLQPRFDVIAVIFEDCCRVKSINHIENAFFQEDDYALF